MAGAMTVLALAAGLAAQSATGVERELGSAGETVKEAPGQEEEQEEKEESGSTPVIGAGAAGQGTPESHPRLGPFELSGEAVLALRLLDVSGNQAQFDEDRNLESGVFLRDLSLDGRRVAGDPGSFSLRAFGIGTRDAGVRAETSYDGVDVLACYGRTRYSGTTSTDVHSFDFEREQAALSVTHAAEAGTLRRAGVEFSWGRRDGFVLGSRSVDFGFVPGVPVDLDERRLGGEGQASLVLGEDFELDLQAGMEDLSTQDRRSFQAPHPGFPQSQVSEDFAADTDGFAHHGSARLRRPLRSGRLEADIGVVWNVVESEGTLDAREIGIFNDPDLPFASDTAGDADFDGRGLGVDAGLTWSFSDGTEVDARFTHERERDDGTLVQTVTLDELMGDPPSVSTFVDDLEHESTLDLLEAGLRAPLGERVDLDLALEIGTEAIRVQDVSDQVVVRHFDDRVDVWGAESSLSAELGASTVELGGGFGIRPTETSRIGVEFTFDDTHTSFGTLAWRWRQSDSTTLVTRARHEQRRSEAFDSQGKFDSFSCTLGTRLGRDVGLDGSFGYRTFDLEADTTFLVLAPSPTEVPGTASFEGIQRLASLGVTWEASEDLHPRLIASASIGSGDGSFDHGAIDLDVPWRLSPSLEIGTSLGWFRFDGDGSLDARDYDATIVTLYARATF
jgi:hypothetical protein